MGVQNEAFVCLQDGRLIEEFRSLCWNFWSNGLSVKLVGRSVFTQKAHNIFPPCSENLDPFRCISSIFYFIAERRAVAATLM